MPSRRGQAVYKRNVRRIRTICENAEHFLASFFQLSGGASPSITGYARILQHAHGLNVKGELPSPLHNPPMRVYALPHKFVYSLKSPTLFSTGPLHTGPSRVPAPTAGTGFALRTGQQPLRPSVRTGTPPLAQGRFCGLGHGPEVGPRTLFSLLSSLFLPHAAPLRRRRQLSPCADARGEPRGSPFSFSVHFSLFSLPSSLFCWLPKKSVL